MERFGRAPQHRPGGFSELAQLDLEGRVDLLVICADVMHYLEVEDLERGLPALVTLTRRPRLLELLTSDEEVEGDQSWR